jgi:hypothetical protein
MADKQKKFFDAPIHFSESAWIEKGEYITKHTAFVEGEHRTRQERLNDQLGALKWAVGDWLCEGADGGIKPKRLMNEAKRITRYQKGTLKNCMVVSRAVESSRRRDDLPYSLHVEVAKYSPEEQDEYLEMAADRRKWVNREPKPISVRDFKVAIRERQRQKMTPEERAAEEGKKPLLWLKVGVTEENRARLREIAHVKGLHGNAADAVLWMAFEYIKEHRAELKAAIEADKALEETEKREAQKRVEAARREYDSPATVAARQANEAERLKEVAEGQEYLKAKLAEGKSLSEAAQMYFRERKAARESPSVSA